jgi:mannose-6-phosphate isomerase-like protein (cupin superfamily)
MSGKKYTAGVGSQKLFENDKVIVWDFVLAPGEETPIHTHEHEYMWYAIEGSTLQVFDENGKDLGTLPVPTGTVYQLKLEDGHLEVVSDTAKGARVPVTHKAKNIGPSRYREILVEWKE